MIGLPPLAWRALRHWRWTGRALRGRGAGVARAARERPCIVAGVGYCGNPGTWCNIYRGVQGRSGVAAMSLDCHMKWSGAGGGACSPGMLGARRSPGGDVHGAFLVYGHSSRTCVVGPAGMLPRHAVSNRSRSAGVGRHSACAQGLVWECFGVAVHGW